MLGFIKSVLVTQGAYNPFMFNKLTAKSAGSKGGKARTKAKTKASRANGALGGCPPTKTLTERLLGRSLQPEQKKYIDQALSDLSYSERVQLQEFFQLESGMDKTMDSTLWRTRSRRVPKDIRYSIKKFRLAANHYLRDVPMPKPYSVEYQRPSLGEQEAWERWHSDSRIPCPPIKMSTDVRRLPDFEQMEFKHKKGVTWTAKDFMEISGQWTKKRAEVAIKWLNATYPPGSLHDDAEHREGKALPYSRKPSALADNPISAALPDIPGSVESREFDWPLHKAYRRDSITPAEPTELTLPVESPVLHVCRDPQDLPDLTEPPEFPDLPLPDEPLEVDEQVDSSSIPWSD